MGQGNRIDRVTRRYELRSGLAMAVFAILVIVLIPRFSEPNTLTALGLIALCSLPLIYTAYEFQRYVRGLDELQSRLEMQAGAIGAGLVLLLAAIWGFGEIFGLLPNVSPVFLLPVATVAHAIVRRVQGQSYE
jgi:hypothetical protein